MLKLYHCIPLWGRITTTSVHFHRAFSPAGFHKSSVVLKSHLSLKYDPAPMSRRTLILSSSNHGVSKNTGEGIIQRLKTKMGFTEIPKSQLLLSGYHWYIKIADEINYKEFFQVCDLEDTFSSWFFVLELHLWMLSARLMQEGEQGRIVRNAMLKAMWEDIDTKSKKLEGALASARKAQITELNEQLQASLLSYDEGLLGSDKVLAGALWRRFLRGKNPESEEELLKQIVALEMLVIYVRHQFFSLHVLSKEQLFFKREIKWTPFTKDLFELVDKKKPE